MYFQKPLTPRNGIKPVVIIGARISGCRWQKEVSLEDQIDHGKEIVRDLYDGEVEYHIISTKGKGERLDRPELAEFEAFLRTRTIDLVVYEDVGRLIRGADAIRLCGIAVDHGTRFLAPHDSVDTDDPNWESDVFEACKEHVGHNAHTSKRLKQKLMNRFRKSGGSLAKLPFGYILPAGGKTYFDVQKDPRPDVPEILQKGKDLLQKTLNYSEVARYFNEVGAIGGTSRRKAKWSGASVSALYHNPILKGHPQRGKRTMDKQHETGRRISVVNPNGPTFIDCPHLAYFSAAELDPLLTELEAKNARHSRARKNGHDSRLRVPRKHTKFPGQFGTCWYCGSHFVWGGNGITNHLMCARSREWKCWNSVGFSGPLFVERLMTALLDRLTVLEGFDAQFRTLIADSNQAQSVESEMKKLRGDEDRLARDRENIVDAIAKYGPEPMFDERMASMARQAEILKAERYRLESLTRHQLEIPRSPSDLRGLMEQSLLQLSRESVDFGLIMREILPEFHVYLVRLCDGGHLLPRIQARLDLSGICPDARLINGLQPLMSSIITIDVFQPPQRERIRKESLKLISEGLQQREACRQIQEHPTQPALQNALSLHHKMEREGLKSPYVMVMSPPEDYKKLRRHKAKHFCFEPIEGYVPPEVL